VHFNIFYFVLKDYTSLHYEKIKLRSKKDTSAKSTKPNHMLSSSFYDPLQRNSSYFADTSVNANRSCKDKEGDDYLSEELDSSYSDVSDHEK
jgi:hypothetical protein